jgi:hypothetical protein
VKTTGDQGGGYNKEMCSEKGGVHMRFEGKFEFKTGSCHVRGDIYNRGKV